MTRRNRPPRAPLSADPFDPFAPPDDEAGDRTPLRPSDPEDADPLPPLNIPTLDWSAPNPDRLRERRARRRGASPAREDGGTAAQATPAGAARPSATMLPIGGGARSTQVRAADRFRLPALRLPVSRVGVYFALSVAFVVAIVVGLGWLRNDPAAIHPNTIWLGTEWTYDAPGAERVVELAKRLDTHRIGRVYAWLSWLQADETWRGTDNFANVKAFVEQARAADPDLELMAWISLPVDAGAGYRLDSIDVQQAVADMAVRALDEFGFDGIFLNIEPVWDGDQAFLATLRRVRAAVGSDVPLSVAIPPDWSPSGASIPVPPLISPGTEWSQGYKQSVALLVDEMALMAYNSGLSDPADYSVWVAYQVSAYAQALAGLGAGTELVVGIPTYDAEPPGHDPAVENVRSAVAGVVQGLADAGDAAAFVRGTALYAGWTTDDREWLDYLQAWVSR